MVKVIKQSNKSLAKSLKEKRLLEKQREKTYRAETNLEKQKLQKLKDIRKNKGKTFKKIAGAIGYRKSLSSNLMRTFGGSGGGARTKGSQQRVKEGPGRPRGDYKHRDPQTGQPIPATLFYKRIKEVKRQAEQNARLRDIQAVQELSKRGIPPSQGQQIVDARQLQSAGVQSQQFQQQVQMQPQRIPVQMSPEMQRQLFIQQLQRQQQTQLTPDQIRILQMQRGTAPRQIWRRNPVIGREGGKLKIYATPQSFWN